MQQHDTARLEAATVSLWETFDRLASSKRREELFRHWRTPGWTTPAEFFLVTTLVETLQVQANQLLNLQEGLLKGNQLILEGVERAG